MRYVRLVAVEDEYGTSPGLALKGAPTTMEGFMADHKGDLIAHDLLEHINGAKHIGNVWDELEALGAIWQVRGRWGEIGRETIHSPAVNVASDLTRMFLDWGGEPMPPSEHRLKATRPHLYDEDFLEIIAIARHDIPKEWPEDFDGASGRGGFEDMERYLAEALHRMRTGFRKAERRYGDRFKGLELFNAIRDKLEKGVKWIDYVGQEFILGYSEERVTFRDAGGFDEDC